MRGITYIIFILFSFQMSGQDFTSQLYFENDLENEDAVLQTKFWPGGVYFVIVKNGEEVLRREKVIHVK